MKLPYVVVLCGLLAGIIGVMVIPAQTDAGRALIFLIALLVTGLLVRLAGAIVALRERRKSK